MSGSARCTGTTKAGEPCQQKAAVGSAFCGLHSPDRKQRPRKRTRTFGGIRKLPSGRFQATYLKDGKRYSETFDRKADANAFLSSTQTDIRRQQWGDPDSGSEPFRPYAEEWLKRNVERGRVRPTTEAKYRGLLDRHILPTFGDVPVGKITVKDVADWHADLAGKHRSTAAGAYRLLATIFNDLVRKELLLRSPCRVEGGSREPSSNRPVASVAEGQAAINATPDEYRAAVMLGAWGALRRGEVLALKRSDLDLSAGTVTVRRAWLVTEEGKVVEGEPKTEAGKRTLHLPDHVQDALKAHLDAYVAPGADAWLFGSANGKPVHPRKFARVWNKARAAAGRPDLRFHDLRHSGLTWFAQLGATQAEIMHRAGHSSPVAAARYQHAVQERDRLLAERLGQLA